MAEQLVVLVSACLLGLRTRYDAKLKLSKECLAKTAEKITIPFCPEQLGGLCTPREAADIVGGDGHDVLAGKARVKTRSGRDVTDEFIQGARQALSIAQMHPTATVFLKARSPSCAVSGRMGVAAALLARHGYELEEF